MAKKSTKKAKRSPAKKKATKPKVTKASAPKATTAIRAMAEPKFNLLTKQIRAHEGRKSTEGAEISSLIAKAVKNDNLDKKAFGIFRSLEKLEDAKLATTLAHFDHYRRIGNLDKRAKAQDMAFPRTEIGEKPIKAQETKAKNGDAKDVTAEVRAADARRASMGIPSVSAARTLPLADAMADAIEADKQPTAH